MLLLNVCGFKPFSCIRRSNCPKKLHKGEKNFLKYFKTSLTPGRAHDKRLEEARRVEDPTLLGNTMQVGRRPTQLGARPCTRQTPRRGTSRESVFTPFNPRHLYHTFVLVLKCFHLVVLPLIHDVLDDSILVARQCAQQTPRRGTAGRRPDFVGKHHASGS